MDSDEHTARTQTHFRAQPHDPALSRLRTFVRIPTHEPSHACAPSSAFLRKSRPASPHLRSHSHARAAPTSAHLRPHSDPLAAPRLRTFARIPTHEPPHACTLLRPTPRSGFAPSAHPHPLFYVLFHSLLRTFSTASTYLFDKSLKGFIQII